MSAAVPPLPGARSRAEPIEVPVAAIPAVEARPRLRWAALRRAIAVQVWAAMAPWRWALVAVALAASSSLIAGQLEASFQNAGLHRRVDAWDLFPGMLLDFVVVFALWGFGFLLFVVDTYQRGRDSGTLSVAFVRMPSRSLYWLGTMGAVGVTAVGLVTAALVIALLTGMVVAPPESLWPMLPREGLPAMYPRWGVPLPVYSIILAGYTAWALWVAGCAVVFLSLFVRRKTVLLVVIVLWNALSMSTHDMVPYMGVFGLLNLGFLLGMFKHQMEDPFPMDQFFAATGGALALMAAVGSWKMRREEP